MSDIRINILEKIRAGMVRPRPRWQFMLMGIGLILLLIGVVMIGGVAMAMVFQQLGSLDWDWVLMSRDGRMGWLLDLMPWMWMVLMLVMGIIAYWLFFRTERGYIYKPVIVVVVIGILSIGLGGVIYAVQGGAKLDEVLLDHVPAYQVMEQRRWLHFDRPEVGLLPVKVRGLLAPNLIQAEDLHGRDWEVRVDVEAEHPSQMNHLQYNDMVILKGRQLDDDTFEAVDMRWKKRLPEHGEKLYKKGVRKI